MTTILLAVVSVERGNLLLDPASWDVELDTNARAGNAAAAPTNARKSLHSDRSSIRSKENDPGTKELSQDFLPQDCTAALAAKP
jgi:hypothetical protein